jgi:anti-sigma B factor antagonist
MNFSVATERDGDDVVISVAGEVDLYTAPELKQELVRVIEEGTRNVIVDMSETTFIDSTTLGVLVSGLKRLRPSGGQLALVVTDRNIRKVFDITGLDRVFPIHETRAEASRAFPANAPG